MLKRIKNKKEKLLILSVFFIAVIIFFIFDIGCVYRKIFGVICPGCGMSRAWEAFLTGKIKVAFGYHAMFWSVPILVLYYLFDGKLFKNKYLNISFLLLIALGFTVNYLFKLI